MTNPFATPAAQNFGLLLARATLGTYFAAVGYKVVMQGVSTFAKANLKSMPSWVTPQYGEVFLTLYPVLQVTAGILLAIGVLPRISSFLLATTLLVYMVCVTGFHAPEGMPFQPNVIFLAVAVALLTNGGGTLTLPALMAGKSGNSGSKGAPSPAAK